MIDQPRILILTLVFAPDGVSTATIMTELAQGLNKLGHDLIVVTTTPHYNRDLDALAYQPLKPKWGQLLFQSEFRGINVYHARVQAKGKRVISRLIDYLRFHIISTLAAWRLGGMYRVVLAPSPPLTIGLSAMMLAFVRGVPFVYNVQEVYPDIAISLGILKNRIVIWALERLEQIIYARAEAVVVISEGFRRRLIAKGVPNQKLHVIPNFVDVGFIQPGDRHNDFSQQQRLDQRFVVLYAGNIGLTQDFETVIAAAKQLADISEICFLIVGDGARREWLVKEVKESAIPNVLILPYQPHSTVPLMYASSDICLVPMLRGTTLGTFPSKIYTIMAAGRPAIVAADPDSELAWVVGESKCGVVVPPGDQAALAEAIRSAYNNRGTLGEMGINGREYAVKNHSPEAVARRYHKLLLAVTRRKANSR